jgi:hypothetical protein
MCAYFRVLGIGAQFNNPLPLKINDSPINTMTRNKYNQTTQEKDELFIQHNPHFCNSHLKIMTRIQNPFHSLMARCSITHGL